MLEIKKIKKISLANVFAFFQAVAGFLLVFGFYSYALLAALKTGQTADPLSKFIWFNVGVAFLSALFTAFFSALAGWLIGFAAAGLYNLLASRSGGLKVEVDGLAEAPPQEREKQEKLFPF